MRLLDRYLLRELLIPLAFCLVGFLIFWNVFSLFTDLGHFQESGLSFGDVVELYLVRVPGNLVLILPVVLLLALLYALTNHARHHELTAIRAAGVGLWRICLPYFGVGFLLSLTLFALNEYCVPDAANREFQIMHRHDPKAAGAPDRDEARNIAGFNNSRDGRRWIFSGYNLRTHIITAPKLIWAGAEGGTMIAERAQYLDGEWTFFNVQAWTNRPGDSALPTLTTNRIALPELSETPEQFEREFKFPNYFNLQNPRPIEVSVADILDYLDLHPHDLSPGVRSGLLTQLHGRLAAPWTCVVVVLIAIPFGAASGRRNLFVGVASSIVICFVYFILFKVGLAAGTGGYGPPWLGAWAPNLCFTLAGFWMMLRVR
jgi:lipopolysaccharide export system permease protein